MPTCNAKQTLKYHRAHAVWWEFLLEICLYSSRLSNFMKFLFLTLHAWKRVCTFYKDKYGPKSVAMSKGMICNKNIKFEWLRQRMLLIVSGYLPPAIFHHCSSLYGTKREALLIRFDLLSQIITETNTAIGSFTTRRCSVYMYRRFRRTHTSKCHIPQLVQRSVKLHKADSISLSPEA
jgi:hypothetical protein